MRNSTASYTVSLLNTAVELLRSSKHLPPIRAACATGGAHCRKFRKLDASVQRDIHELSTRSAGDLLGHWFESDALSRKPIV